MSWKTSLAVALLLAVAACGPGPGSTGGLGRDAGIGTDGGTATDGGIGTDGGTPTDGGTATDGGIGTDGGPTTDGGTATDGGDGGLGTGGGPGTQPVRVRACNAGTVTLDDVTFTFREATGNHLDFGTLAPDGTSPFQLATGLSPCFFSVRAVVDGTPMQVLGNPDCGVTLTGPKPLPPGDHTWVLSATQRGGLHVLGLDSPTCP